MSRISMSDKIQQQVEALEGLPREELVERWCKAHGCSPPSGVRRELLIRSAAWYLQSRRLGGFSPGTRRQLNEAMHRGEFGKARKTANRVNDSGALANAVETGQNSERPASSGKTRRSLSPGARLLREWNGRTHVVDVIENGFAFEGQVFRSLSAIARQITGVQWSGPRFFGL